MASVSSKKPANLFSTLLPFIAVEKDEERKDRSAYQSFLAYMQRVNPDLQYFIVALALCRVGPSYGNIGRTRSTFYWDWIQGVPMSWRCLWGTKVWDRRSYNNFEDEADQRFHIEKLLPSVFVWQNSHSRSRIRFEIEWSISLERLLPGVEDELAKYHTSYKKFVEKNGRLAWRWRKKQWLGIGLERIEKIQQSLWIHALLKYILSLYKITVVIVEPSRAFRLFLRADFPTFPTRSPPQMPLCIWRI